MNCDGGGFFFPVVLFVYGILCRQKKAGSSLYSSHQCTYEQGFWLLFPAKLKFIANWMNPSFSRIYAPANDSSSLQLSPRHRRLIAAFGVTGKKIDSYSFFLFHRFPIHNTVFSSNFSKRCFPWFRLIKSSTLFFSSAVLIMIWFIGQFAKDSRSAAWWIRFSGLESGLIDWNEGRENLHNVIWRFMRGKNNDEVSVLSSLTLIPVLCWWWDGFKLDEYGIAYLKLRLTWVWISLDKTIDEDVSVNGLSCVRSSITQILL